MLCAYVNSNFQKKNIFEDDRVETVQKSRFFGTNHDPFLSPMELQTEGESRVNRRVRCAHDQGTKKYKNLGEVERIRVI